MRKAATPTPVKPAAAKSTSRKPLKSAAEPKPAKPQATKRSSRNVAPPPVAEPTSKRQHLLTLIQRPQGATLDELMTATGWQAHSIRGHISAVLRKQQGYVVRRLPNPQGLTAYRIGA